MNQNRKAHRHTSSRRSAVVDFLERENYLSLERREQRALLEKVIGLVLGRTPPGEDTLDLYGAMIREIEEFSTRKMKAVIFGGGTGLSTILGGDSTQPGWCETPFFGLKEHFEDLTVAVCVTDDGGSSGELVRRLPVIALGDIRRAVLSAVTRKGLKRVYQETGSDRIDALPGLLQKLMNHRFKRNRSTSVLNLLSSAERRLIPKALAAYLEESLAFFRSHGDLKTLSTKGHCLGNLLLLSEIYRSVGTARKARTAPDHKQVLRGIGRLARAVGAGKIKIYPVSTHQGELKFLYTNGVVVSGEHKSSVSCRGFPVDRVWAEYVGGPRVDARLVKSIADAEIIIIAPGSIYSSLIPILQLSEVADAVRRNRLAIKILGTNFWVQQGETDLSIRDLVKEFFVSDLIEAYDKNVAGGTSGLINLVVSTNLKNLPADVIQSYALEGKVPIYLDKDRVEALGFEPLAADIHSLERLAKGKVFQHDPARFSQTVHTLVFLEKTLRQLDSLLAPRARGAKGVPSAAGHKPDRPFASGGTRDRHLCDYMEEVDALLAAMTIPSKKLLRLLPDLFWQNRDILLDHLKFLRGIRVVPKNRWLRSTVWDRILAYFDPDDSILHCRSDLLDADRDRLREDLLIGLGESLLGNYALRKSLRPLRQKGETIGKIFEITLRPCDELRAFLSLDRIKEYLELSRLRAAAGRPGVYRLVINGDDSFTPPGLNFGLLYSWYLNNSFGGVIEYETSLLKIATSDLIPKLTMDQERQRKLIGFFRRHVFRH